MNDSRIDLVGYCGLYCPDCIRYRSRAADLAGALLDELKNTEFGKYAELKGSTTKQFNAVAQFRHYGEFREVLEAIINLQCNTPCRLGDGCSTFSCSVLKCCRDNGFDGCWQCDDFENCSRFEPLESVHGCCPKENLKKIKTDGLDKWVGNRYKPYIWQQSV